MQFFWLTKNRIHPGKKPLIHVDSQHIPSLGLGKAREIVQIWITASREICDMRHRILGLRAILHRENTALKAAISSQI